ncbi:uncharacterized protein LOC129579157 isoform X2 [Sitodiplosis mosellana]|uniref:uncharacterized protein LOC129579157 isoform X2 n=1 Tax=Sitodiplosis mosellana TaxID=263140 RepID=UPI002443ABF1|nr:uncharacterized protein LOC129579157 isoform X2 [Sitodiplosis mosellana]
MIKHETDLKCDLMSPSLCMVVQRLFYRKRRHVTSCYEYSSHGLFYVLLLLIYSQFLIKSPAIVLAEITTMSQIKGSTNDERIKTSNEMDHIVMAVKVENIGVAADADAAAAAAAVAVADDEYFEDDQDDDKEYKELLSNKSAKGMYVGSPCERGWCNIKLHHVICDKATNTCICEKKYPVVIGLLKGCAKPKKLGEQCFYDQTCMHNDINSLCIQIRHNALCQCVHGFHSVSYLKPTKRVFCTEDMSTLTSDLPTLLGVSTGIAVLAGLICMVLHLFTKTKYPRHRHFNDNNLPPPIMYSSDTVHSARPSSRSASIRSSNSFGSYGHRRPSSAPHTNSSGSKGVLVSTSRSGSRRPSLASVHSTSSSIKSYSAARFEKELQQKEMRQEMKLRLTRLQQQQQLIQNKPHIIITDPHVIVGGAVSRAAAIALKTPSPLTPNSLDELLPCVIETAEPPTPVKLHRSEAYTGLCKSSLSDELFN